MSVRNIAERAGVSVATVSRVLHRSDKVKPETRQVVEQAMQELGFSAGALMRRAKIDTCVVGVVVPDLSNAFFTEVISGMHEVAAQRNLSLFICDTHENDQAEIHYLRLLKDAHVQGIIITPTSDDDDCVNNEYLNMLSNIKIPVVLVDRDVKYSNFPGVFIDNLKGAYEATKLLIDQGHTQIAVIAGPINTKPGRERLQGYRDAFQAANLKLDEQLICYGDFSLESGRLHTQAILRDHPQVTAIFTCNNLMTVGCLDILRKEGKMIPDDMALVGFDEIATLTMLGIDITEVDRPTQEMGRQAMKLLFNLMNHKDVAALKRITLMPELHRRGSECKVRHEAKESEGKGEVHL